MFSTQRLAAALFLSLALLVTPGLGQCHEAFQLVPAGLSAGEGVGNSAATAGDLAVFGARSATGGGAVYVYRLVAGTWTEQQRLTGSDQKSGDEFGYAVATDANRIVVGARYHDSADTNAGAVYVFSFDGLAWVEDQKLTASDAQNTDALGSTVALEGTTIVAGAPLDDDLGRDAGAAYFFEHAANTWTETQKLTASDGSADSEFGHACAISAARLLIGAFQDDESGSDAGATYAFELQAGSFQEVQKILPAALATNDWFGKSVAMHGNRAVIGAPRNSNQSSGRAYLMNHDGVQWNLEAELFPPKGLQGLVGWSVDLNDDTVLVGAPGATDQHGSAGLALVWRQHGQSWFEWSRLGASNTSTAGYFGWSVALSGDTALMGSKGADPGGLTNAGAIYGQITQYVLAAGPDSPQVGDPYSLDVISGTPGHPVLLLAVELNSVPIFQILMLSNFGADGQFHLGINVPPELSGLSIGFQALRAAPWSGVQGSNVVVTDFQ